MFTGITEETGKIISADECRVTVGCRKVLENSEIGSSIAVNGVCLTISCMDSKSFSADVSPETRKITVLNPLKTGSVVNLERALPAEGRFGGHIVTGHAEGTAKILDIKKNNNFYDFQLELTPNMSKYTAVKGSVAVNGISLTISDIKTKKNEGIRNGYENRQICGNIISLAVIPHTFENTNLKYAKIGGYVNIETDILSKYVEKFLLLRDNRTRVSADFLERNGFC